jgi:hypothetical protein
MKSGYATVKRAVPERPTPNPVLLWWEKTKKECAGRGEPNQQKASNGSCTAWERRMGTYVDAANPLLVYWRLTEARSAAEAVAGTLWAAAVARTAERRTRGEIMLCWTCEEVDRCEGGAREVKA